MEYLTLEDYTVTVSSTGTQFESITPQLTLCFSITEGGKIEQHLSTTATDDLRGILESNGEGFGVVGDNEETGEHVTNWRKFGSEVFPFLRCIQYGTTRGGLGRIVDSSETVPILYSNCLRLWQFA